MLWVQIPITPQKGEHMDVGKNRNIRGLTVVLVDPLEHESSSLSSSTKIKINGVRIIN